MKQQFSKKEEEFFKRQRGDRSNLKVILIVIAFILFIGLLLDAFSGFYIIKHSKSIYSGISGLFLFLLFYLFGEAGAGWINSKDDVSHPLYKRVFHLFLLLFLSGIVITLCWLLFDYFDLLKLEP